MDPDSSPLDTLTALVDQARDIPPAPALTPAGDPMDQLRSLLRGQPPSPPATSSPPPSPSGPASPSPTATSPGEAPHREARLGRAVLDLAATTPLPGAHRARALALLIDALDDPTPESLQPILALLLPGSPALEDP